MGGPPKDYVLDGSCGGAEVRKESFPLARLAESVEKGDTF